VSAKAGGESTYEVIPFPAGGGQIGVVWIWPALRANRDLPPCSAGARGSSIAGNATPSQPSSLSLMSPSVSPSYVRAVVLVVAALIPTTMLSGDDLNVRSMCLLRWGALRGTAGYCDVG
jgi:hypothetical protein